MFGFSSKKNEKGHGKVVDNKVLKTKDGRKVHIQTIQPRKTIKPAR
jgi:hypothetical protein